MVAPHKEVLTPTWALPWPQRTLPALPSLPAVPHSLFPLYLVGCISCTYAKGSPHTNSLGTYWLREPHNGLYVYRVPQPAYAPLFPTGLGSRSSETIVSQSSVWHHWQQCMLGAGRGPTRWEGKACLHPLPTWLAELNGVELGGGESHPRMVPGGECHQKEASGTRARKGIQDNLKSDSQGNRPALS